MRRRLIAAALLFGISAGPLAAAEYPSPREGDWIARDFRFHTGEVLPELRLHYTTVGNPAGEPVLLLHGTAGAGANFLTAQFAGELFGPGQPLDATKYFIVAPDAIGAGKSTKPSDGLRAKFPRYDYADMVEAQFRLVTEGLGIKHLRLVIGNSMGGMQTWLWGELHPDAMDGLVPMASQPAPMASRNWMLRRMLVEMIEQDPAYAAGNYTTQPKSLALANVFFGIATSGGTLGWQAQAPNRAAADKIVDERLAARPPTDANDFIYQWSSSADYDPSDALDRIAAPVLAINAADDERNPPETGVTEKLMARVRNARLVLIPASAKTRGHATTGIASFWKAELQAFIDRVPRRTM